MKAGSVTAYLKELVAYWIDGYDWRKQERAINAYPQFRTEIDGVPIHFIHVRGTGPNPKPLILSDGWPWTSALSFGPTSTSAATNTDESTTTLTAGQCRGVQ